MAKGVGESLGRSRGGLSTKIHLVADAQGRPMRFSLTGGQRADVSQAIPLLSGMETGAVIADKGYESNQMLAFIRDQGAEAVMPPNSNRGNPWEYNRERNLIKQAFNKLKRTTDRPKPATGHGVQKPVLAWGRVGPPQTYLATNLPARNRVGPPQDRAGGWERGQMWAENPEMWAKAKAPVRHPAPCETVELVLMGEAYQGDSTERKRGGPKDRLEWLADTMLLDLTANEVKALVTAVRRSDPDGTFWMNQRTWAAECGLYRQNLNRAVKGLVDRGLLVVKEHRQKKGRTNIYQLAAGRGGWGVNQFPDNGTLKGTPDSNPVSNPVVGAVVQQVGQPPAAKQLIDFCHRSCPGITPAPDYIPAGRAALEKILCPRISKKKVATLDLEFLRRMAHGKVLHSDDLASRNGID